jgi:hypothetical protein
MHNEHKVTIIKTSLANTMDERLESFLIQAIGVMRLEDPSEIRSVTINILPIMDDEATAQVVIGLVKDEQ